MEEKFNVLIVGAGSIGAFFDAPCSKNILTHAHAFSKIEKFNLLGFVDISKQKGEEAAKLWNVNYFSSMEEAFSKNKVDVVSVCVPDEYHYDILKKVSSFPMKLVFAEKPLTTNLDQAEEIMKIYKKKNMKCLINYSRRFVSEFSVLRDNILNCQYGEYICGNGYYGKGILHSGSHMIDFLRYLIGEVEDEKSVDCNFDFYNNDPSITSILSFKDNKIFTMNIIPCNNYTVFEIDLLFQEKRIRITDLGFSVEEYGLVNSEIFNDYINIGIQKKYSTDFGNAMKNAVINIYNNLVKDENLKCTLDDGYKALNICEKLKAGITSE